MKGKKGTPRFLFKFVFHFETESPYVVQADLNPPASASLVLGLQVYVPQHLAVTPSLISNLMNSKSEHYSG